MPLDGAGNDHVDARWSTHSRSVSGAATRPTVTFALPTPAGT